MLNWGQIQSALPAAVAAAFWIFVVGYAAYSSQHPPQTPQVYTEQKAKNGVGAPESSDQTPTPARTNGGQPCCPQTEQGSKQAFHVTLGEGLLSFFTFLLFLATGALVLDAKKTAKQELRAYVFIETAVVTLEQPTYFALLNFRNFGKTPAYDMNAWIHAQYRAPGNPPVINPLESPPAGERHSLAMVGPGATFRLTSTDDFSRNLPENEVGIAFQWIESGQSQFLIRGDLSYRDVYDRRWELTFQYLVVREQGKWLLQPTQDGNAECQLS